MRLYILAIIFLSFFGCKETSFNKKTTTEKTLFTVVPNTQTNINFKNSNANSYCIKRLPGSL